MNKSTLSDSFHLLPVDKNLNIFSTGEVIDERFSSLRKIVSSTFDNVFKLNTFLFQRLNNKKICSNLFYKPPSKKNPLASVLEHVQLKNAADNDDSCCTGLRRKEISQAARAQRNCAMKAKKQEFMPLTK